MCLPAKLHPYANSYIKFLLSLCFLLPCQGTCHLTQTSSSLMKRPMCFNVESMTDSKAIHLLWQLLPASYETTVTMNGLECFATHAWMDQFTLCCLIPLRRLYRFILASWKGTIFDWKYLYFCKDTDLFM